MAIDLAKYERLMQEPLPEQYEPFADDMAESRRERRESLARCSALEAMSPWYSGWDAFCDHLSGPQGCDFREEGGWSCSCDTARPFAVLAMKRMGFTDAQIEASLSLFAAWGGFCDCEILFNVDRFRIHDDESDAENNESEAA